MTKNSLATTPEDTLTTTTLRIGKTELSKFRNKARSERIADGKGSKMGSMNSLMLRWINEYCKGDKPSGLELATGLSAQSENNLAVLLAEQVSANLKSNIDWARDVIRATPNPRWPAEGILRRRLAHYALDKAFVSQKFAQFLRDRIEYLLDQDIDVHLLLDAGSSVLYQCHALWPHLKEITKKDRSAKITLITNNLSAADSFAEERQHGAFMKQETDGDAGQQEHARKKEQMPGTAVTCKLLGGDVQFDYAALTGDLTVQTLKQLTTPRNNLRRISLLAANYIRLDKLAHPASPIPLIRGRGQKAVKEAYSSSSCADEVYILGATPGKIFDASRGEITEALDIPYDDVVIQGDIRPNVKLVTTFRQSDESVLKDHSVAIEARLGGRISAGQNDPTTEPKDLPLMNHFGYYYDPHARQKDTEQLELEFPHLFEKLDGPADGKYDYKTRIDIMTKFFRVKLK